MFGRIALVVFFLFVVAFFWPLIKAMALDAMDLREEFQREIKQRAEARKKAATKETDDAQH